MSFDPRNILIIDFGQLGDVVMSLPALRAIRERFPAARITVAVGKSGAQVIDLSGYADDKVVVDRVSLRDGFKPLSVLRIFKLVGDVRRRGFDFVIDLHSLSETNILGFLSGAPKRLFSRRPGRSLDFLSKFDSPPPVDHNDPKVHLTDRYLDVLKALGITGAPRAPRLTPRSEDQSEVDRRFKKVEGPLVGIHPGAGHASRRWPLERFAELADSLTRNDRTGVIVFVGPEEHELLVQIRSMFPRTAIVLDDLTIGQLLAAQVRLSVFVANDSGPLHLAAAAGTPVVGLFDPRAPETYIPVNDPKRIIRTRLLTDVSVEEVYIAARQLLVGGRVETLFANSSN